MRSFVLGSAVVAAVTLFASCGGTNDSSCNADTCNGCCMNGVCQGGTSTNACGEGGNACNVCSSGLSCISGACQQGTNANTCNSTNCAGCCLNGACQAGTTPAACGKNGAACSPCDNNQVCRQDQTCGVDPESTWRVQPVRAKVAANDNGTDWDGDGSAPDVVVAMACPPLSAPVQSGTPEVQSYNPTWTSGGCVTKAKHLLAEQWVMQVWDIDFADDDTITQPLGYQFTESDFVRGSVTFSASGGMESMALELQKQ